MNGLLTELREEKGVLSTSKKALPRECTLTDSTFEVSGKPEFLVPLSELRVHDLCGGGSEGQALCFRVSQGIKPLLILAAPDATTKVEWLRAFEEGIRRNAAEEDQLDTFWLHRTHITGTLHAASVAGDAEALNTILSLSLFDADGVDGEGVTPLCAAAAGGHGECVEALLSSGATLGTTDRDGATPLHLAIAGGHTSAANTLVANGAPLDATDLLGRTPLGLLLASPHPLASPTPEHRSLASLMLAYGASPSDPDSEGFTPLHRVAVVSGGGGCEALVVALGRKGGEGAVTALLQHPGGGDDALNPLHLACGARFDGEELARDGVPIPCGDGDGDGNGDGGGGGGGEEGGSDDIGPLPTSVLPISIPTISALLAWGAPPNAPTHCTGETPLHLLLRAILALQCSTDPSSSSSSNASLASDYTAAVFAVGAAGGRVDSVDKRGVKVSDLVKAAGLKVKRGLESAFGAWEGRKPPKWSPAMKAGGEKQQQQQLQQQQSAAGSKLAAFGAKVGGFFSSLGGKGGSSNSSSKESTPASTPNPSSAAAAAAGGGASCPICTATAPPPLLTICALCCKGVCGACSRCSVRGVGGMRSTGGGERDSDDDEEGESTTSSTPRTPSTPTPLPLRLCDPCSNKALSSEAAAGEEARKWEEEKAAALAQARNFNASGGGTTQQEGGGKASLASVTRGMAATAAVRGGGGGAAAPATGAGAAPTAAAAAALFGDRQGKEGKGEKEKGKGGFMASTMGSLSALMQGNKEKLMERGEKLQRTEDRSADLAKDAANFGSLAEQLKKKAQGGWGGLF